MNGTGVDLMLSGTAAQQSNSKASTVELAIDYIKGLQKELGDARSRLELLEGEKRALADANVQMNGDGVKAGEAAA